MKIKVAIIGSGPAALMAADVLQTKGIYPSIFEQRRSFSWRLILAGSSRLNLANAAENPCERYTPSNFLRPCLDQFSPQQWVDFVENAIDERCFIGSSQRWLLKSPNAESLLDKWIQRLSKVQWNRGYRCIGVSKDENNKYKLQFEAKPESEPFDRVIFAAGGGSWLANTKPIWPKIFASHGIMTKDFEPANVGFEVDWNPTFLEKSEGHPLKDIVVSSAIGSSRGDLIVTKYGLEGAPIYAVGCSGTIKLDLLPQLSLESIQERVDKKKLRRIFRDVARCLKLSSAKESLLYFGSSVTERSDPKLLIQRLKNIEIILKNPRPLREAISSRGGIALQEVDPHSYSLHKLPGVYAVGEMLDWHAPTGGFLIQACVAQGAIAARHILL